MAGLFYCDKIKKEAASENEYKYCTEKRLYSKASKTSA
jgi:hypothetical protein